MATLEQIKGYKNIVIKIGSSLIVDETGSVRTEWLRSLVRDISELKKKFDKYNNCYIRSNCTRKKNP